MNGFKNWITLAALAVAPATFAQGTRTMEEAKASTVDVALTATGVQARDEQQVDDLRKEIDALRSEVNEQQQREDRRREFLGDPDSHPLWP
jgi:TolA-binding protein